MREKQQPADVAAAILSVVSSIISQHPPDMIIVQGDTTTTIAEALAGFYSDIPVVLVEAGR